VAAPLTIKLDAKALEQWALTLSTRGLRNAIRRAVDKSATAARKVAVETIAKDIGVPKARLRTAVTKLRRTTQTDLSASFTADKSAINMLATGATVTRAGGMTGSTYRISGGTSSALKAKHAFIMTVNGASFVVVRKGKSHLPVKGIYAEAASYALGEGEANKVWQKEANKQLAERLPVEIAKQLLAEGMPYSAPADSE